MIAHDDSMELRGCFLLGGEAGELYATFSPYDDYLELTFPPDHALMSAARSALERLPSELEGSPFDVRFLEGERVTACVLVLYVSAPLQRSRPHSQRLEGILHHLTLAIPSLDFGNLLPRPPVDGAIPATPPASHSAGAPAPLVEALPLDPGGQPWPSEPNGSKPHGSHPHAPESSGAMGATNGKQWEGSMSLLVLEDEVNGARSLAARGQLHKAIRSAESILRDCPDHPGATDLLREIKLLEKRDKRRRREPGNAQAHLEAGFSYLMLNCNREAVKPLHQAGRISPNLYLAHLLLGIAHHRQGDADAARAAYRKADRLRPQDAIHADLLAALDRGDPPVAIAEERRDCTQLQLDLKAQIALRDQPHSLPLAGTLGS